MSLLKIPSLLAGLFLVTAALFTACGHADKTPSQVVRELYEAANAGRYSAVEKSFCAKARRYIKGEYPSGLKPLCDQQTNYGTIAQVEILQEQIKGGEAMVLARIRFKNKTVRHEQTRLVKEKGEWKIALGS